MKHSLSVLGAAAALTLALAGCGSSSTPASGESAAPSSLQEIQDSGVLTVGTEGTYRPFSFHEGGSGALTGYDVEVITAVAEKMGVEAEFEETQWDAIFAGLEAGRFDVIANQVSITDERKESYDFSEPYTVSSGVIVTTADNDDISSFEDLDGKTTAQSLTSNWNDLAKESGANVEPVEGWAQSVTLLEQGRVDATINDELTYLDYQKNNSNENIKIAATTEENSQSAVAVRKGSTELVDAIDSALEELRADGTLAEISQKYFGSDVSE
ncbi:amino acid ABC transporter substrate-binding protein [Arthrobacter agilis]|uniref:amino acid ABC transporter substrate-binding protein n=1 Tax=Arthrobacter agilis TaxID=37921 RepID=UPI000B35D0E8|nr:amino acid ABC transporter substrate-binding protein [Arthrobacter agilis]OUM40735.1 polar amino acid ABC transporter substrate-binding protein [Arthrobacter agilis]PPB45341.1 polar amino acid ABC transporter substrate-binding protein [Arthrobacter agilis]TPV28049.1 amino acid ABC transporter substrate-binding protein [Arthrobacter agilis]VDR31253.1 L-cystine-binding protein tcyA precursor [Arthrobacter agilis]